MYIMCMSKSSFFSNRISHRFKKVMTIFCIITFGFLALLIFFIWYVSFQRSLSNKQPVQKIVQSNTSTSVKGVDTNKEDEEISSKYKGEISSYIENIKANFVIIDATFSYMEDNPLESSPYIADLEVSMNKCVFSKYPYSKEMFFPEELITKVNNLEILTKSLCNTLSESTNQLLRFFKLEDMTEMKEVYMGIYDMNEEAYEKRLVIDKTCDEIEELILL